MFQRLALRSLSLLAILAGLVAPLHAQLVISEFLASNSNSVVDEDGNHEDWIEIQNTAATGTSTLSWYLTDDPTKPRKWAFSNRTIAANGYLVVFASDKDRKPASGNLHTSFKLSATPGYLALTHDIAGGGVVVVQEFNLYPQQATDISYGAASSTTTTPLVAAAAPVKAFVPPSDALGSTWQGAAANEPFADGGWLSGTTGVGFGDSSVPVGLSNLKQRLNADSSGAIVSDSSGAAHSATNNGAAWVASNTDAAGTPRTRTGVMQFVGSENDQVTTPGDPDFDKAQCTVTMWMRSAGLTGTGGEGAMLWDRRANGNSGPGTLFVQHTNGKIFFQAANGACSFSSIASISDDRWHHIAVVMDTAPGATNTMYVDGVTSGSGTNNTSGWGWLASQAIALGRSPDGYWYKYNGFMDDVRFYDRQLTQEEVSQIYIGADEPMAPGDIGLNVQSQMMNINPGIYTRTVFNVANPSSVATLRLTQRSNDGFVAYVNGTKIAAQNAPALPVYNSVATGTHGGSILDVFNFAVPNGLLRSGSNILAIHGLNIAAADNNFLMLPKLDGIGTAATAVGYTIIPTPGAANSPVKTNVGPFVSAVTKNPSPRPTGTAASPVLTITATVTPSLRPLAAVNPVQLKYLIMFGAEQTVNMSATGTPGVYSAAIPTNNLGPGQMLRWRVVATDNVGAAGTAPEFSDQVDNERYYGTVAVDSTIQTNLPVIYWFTPSSTAADNTTGTRNSFFFKAPGDTGVGRFYDNVEINLHGQSSSGFPKKSYDIDFNEDNRFEWSISGERVKDVNLLTNYGDKSKTHNQMTHEALSVVGSVHHWCYQVRVQQVTTANAAAPGSHFFSIADMMEDGDDDFMARNGRDPNGALYKIYDSLSGSGSAEKKTRQFENKADLDALIAGLNPSMAIGTRRQFAYDNLDLPQCISYFVGLAITSSQDHGHKNYYVYRDTLRTREWSILPWDVDLTWGRNWQDSPGYFTDTMFTNNDLDMYNSAMQGKGENRLYSLIVGNSDISRIPAPEFRDMVLRRLRTVMDGYFSAPNVLETRFGQLADLMDPPAIGTSDADRDFSKWPNWGTAGGATGSVALRYHIDQIRNVYLPGRRTFLNTATIAGVPVPASQPATAPNLITIETIDFNPSTQNQGHEFFVIRNANTYSVDVSGWKITGAVEFTFKPGTVIPPGGGVTENRGDLYVTRDPLLFRQRATIPDDNLPGSNQYRFVTGPFNGSLSARGETVELRDASGALLRSKSWTAAPTVAQNQLRISELNYAPVAPSVSEKAALSGVTSSDFEYIELINTGATSLTLTGAKFDKGVTFTFPAFTLAAGARCLLVANTVAFQLRYGHAFDAMIAGQYDGSLDNNGETIRLLDPSGEEVLDFTYSNSWWPPSDEGGRTLVVRELNAPWQNYDLPQQWTLSGQVGGSPGSTDSDFASHYDGWRWDYFTAAEIPTVADPGLPAALTLDPDGDGMNNMGEYAFARNPKAADIGPVLSSSIVNDGGTNYLAVTFKRRHKALDLGYFVEVSDNLVTWIVTTTQVGLPVDLGGGVEQVTIRDFEPYNPAPAARYMRVRAVK